MLALLALAPRLLVAWTLPLAALEQRPDCAPDEGLQFWTVMHYAAGNFATWPESGSIYSAYPPAQYALHAATLASMRSAFGDRWPARFPSSWWRLESYTAARLGGALLGCVTAVLAALSAQAWCNRRWVALASGIAVALYPQLVFVNGYVNGDSFTIAAVACLMLALSWWATMGEERAGVVWVGVAAGVVMLGKPTGYATLVPTAVWLLGALRRGRLDAASLAAAGAAMLLVCVPILAFNGIRNHGDPLGLVKYRELLASSYHARPGSGPLAELLPSFLRDVAQSSFGVFRNADLRLPAGFFAGAAGFLAAGIVAGAVRIRRASNERRRVGATSHGSAVEGKAVVWLASILSLNLAVVVWNSWTVDYQPQGRYLLPALMPMWVAITCALGCSRRGGLLVALWLGFLATATLAAIALIHANPCVAT
jgi:hypothetical protein